MSSGGDGGGGVRRVVRPRGLEMPSLKEYEDARSRLLSKLGDSYGEACERLAVRGRPGMLARLLDAGVCIGMLDPVSNVIANALCTTDAHPDRSRDEAAALGAAVEEKVAEMGRRSLDGLVAFLLYFFPYLAYWDAERYLLLAGADLLVAARIIVADRRLDEFSPTSDVSTPAFEAGLALAAQVAKHPHPKLLVDVWMSLSSRLHRALDLLSEVQHHSPRQDLHRLSTMLKEEPASCDLAVPWDLAAYRRLHNYSGGNVPYQLTRSLRNVLLDTIHGFYLQALARLPRRELRTRFHRSLLMAGHCQGPMDPVSNIIINTIWYDVNFPAAEIPVLDMIGPDSLRRLEARSFYGLMSFIKTRYPHLSEHQAVERLISACAQLSIADPNLCPTGDAEAETGTGHPLANIQEAYAAAAIAAWHPKPEDHAVFLASLNTGHQIMSQLNLGQMQQLSHILSPELHQLNSEEVQNLANFLSSRVQPTPERICKPCYPARAGKWRSEAQQKKITRMVENAVGSLQDGKSGYNLHIICCVNDCVSGPEFCEDYDPLAFAPCKYRHSHVNFLATRKYSQSSDCYPMLFFAEFDNEKEDAPPLLCCRVADPASFVDHVRCFYCEVSGSRVVHPAFERFHGRGREFEEMIRGEHSLRHEWFVSQSNYYVQRMCAVEEDFLYVDVD
ncbi:hypothetical protein ACP4OV_014762 [Aristida adscensionis]